MWQTWSYMKIFFLSGNVKDFESDEIFDFIILFAKFFLCKYKLENKCPFLRVVVKTTDLKA